MSTLLFAGAAGEVTGSRHLLRLPQGTLLLDCGMFQGRREESDKKTRRFLFEPGSVDAVLLSHAHIDHCGSLPLLMKQGFGGPIYCTPASAELARLLLDDSARIQAADARFLRKRDPSSAYQPAYDGADVEACSARFRTAAYGLAVEVLPGVRAHFHEAGHILGSAMVSLHWEEAGRRRSLLYSGDLGRPSAPLLKDPFQPPLAPEILLLESTYGDRDHGREGGSDGALAGLLKPVLRAGGKVLIPAFAVGRSQELLAELAGLISAGGLPRVPVFVDSPLAAAATRVFERHPELMDADFHRSWRSRSPFGLPFVEFTDDKEASQAINDRRGPCVILSASGMCESGRVLHHLRRILPAPANLLLFVGFQAQGTLGRRLKDGAGHARIFGEEVPVACQVASLDAYSAHADRSELLAWAAALPSPPAQAYLVHGELSASSSLASALRERGWKAEVPLLGREAQL